MKVIVERLNPGTDLKNEIKRVASENEITSGCIINAVGSLVSVKVRTDATNGVETFKEFVKVEVVSLTGTIGEMGKHLHVHLSGSDIDGNVIGGHLSEGCIVKTTIELMILVFEDLRFLTELDPNTGFKELYVKQK